MADKIVSYDIRVPAGDYCWKYLNGEEEGCLCQFFDNEGGYATCDLGLYGQEEDQIGVLKADKCKNFKEVKL